MKRILSVFCALLALPLLFACTPSDGGEVTTGSTDYSMKATVCELGEKLLVEVAESETGMTGPFLINTDKSTVYKDAEGKDLSPKDIKVGDVIEIFYSGQVMMSYPAQVYAAKIVKK